MACELPQRNWGAGITALRVGALVVGVAAAAGTIVLGTDQLASQVARLLLAAAWVLLALGFGIPVVTAAEIGDPRLGKLLTVLRDRNLGGQQSTLHTLHIVAPHGRIRWPQQARLTRRRL